MPTAPWSSSPPCSDERIPTAGRVCVADEEGADRAHAEPHHACAVLVGQTSAKPTTRGGGSRPENRKRGDRPAFALLADRYDAWDDGTVGHALFQCEGVCLVALVSALPHPRLEAGVGNGLFSRALAVGGESNPAGAPLRIRCRPGRRPRPGGRPDAAFGAIGRGDHAVLLPTIRRRCWPRRGGWYATTATWWSATAPRASGAVATKDGRRPAIRSPAPPAFSAATGRGMG